MNKIEQGLFNNINHALKTLYDLNDESLIMIEIPRDNKNGDYSTNVAMRLTKILKKAPQIIANELKTELEKDKNLVESVEIAGPGFINFWIKNSSLGNVITDILTAKEKYGENNVGENLPVLVEYVSANPTGDLHAGHARGAVWGDSICRLYKKSGFDVLREYYINDAGVQMTNLGISVYARYAEFFGVKVEIPQDGFMGEDVKEIGIELAKELGDYWLTHEEGRIGFFKQKGYEKELDKIKRDLKNFRIEFDSCISEHG